jgi:hypothetical protein
MEGVLLFDKTILRCVGNTKVNYEATEVSVINHRYL